MRYLFSFLLVAALVALYEFVILPGVFRLFGGTVRRPRRKGELPAATAKKDAAVDPEPAPEGADAHRATPDTPPVADPAEGLPTSHLQLVMSQSRAVEPPLPRQQRPLPGPKASRVPPRPAPEVRQRLF